MIDLSAKPFYLKPTDEEWVYQTIDQMSLDEKLGQLFIDHSEGDYEDEYVKKRLKKTMAGGLRYVNLPAEEMKEHNLCYQKYTKIPLLIASNTEAGGNGALKGGTQVGCEAKIAATGEEYYAYQLGLIGAREAKAVGCNWAFMPIVDLSLNWRNPIISTRTWGDQTDLVIKLSRACLKGLHEGGVAATAKHFPGDGVDERDHHYSSTVNTLSVKEWDASYGKIYKAMIEDGTEAIMAGHIMLPAYQKALNPETKENEYMPASMCEELLTGLLRKKLQFNGLIVTDASHMVGFSSRMSRKNGLVTAINAGCDMILFYNDPEEDLAYMKEAVAEGTLSIERIDEALTRILALKASLGLHKNFDFTKEAGDSSVIGCKEHKQIAEEVSSKAITLAKQVGKSLLPITPEKYRRIMIMPVNTNTPEFAKLVGALGGTEQLADDLKEKLEQRGFEVTIFESPLKKANGRSAYDYKESIEKFKNTYDLGLTIANCGSFGVTQRLNWDTPKGGFEIPWYVYEVPVIFISFNSPFHLADVPEVKTMINCYDAQPSTLAALVDKLTGRTEFMGKSPVDVYCGFLDTHL